MAGPAVTRASGLSTSLHTQIFLGVLLTAGAGFVDAVGYIGLGGLFASFMSGASVSLGVGLESSRWDVVGQGLFMIASFLGGVTLGTFLSGVLGLWAPPAILLLEALLLAGAALLDTSGWTISASIVPVTAAMGIQNTALPPVNGVRLGATFITGTLVSLGQALGRALLGQADTWRLPGHALLWGALVAGALAGARLTSAFGAAALIVPAVLVGSLAFLSAVLTLARRMPDPACQRRDLEADRPSVWPYT